jgi:3-methyladenine DNA glycosylase/8-oxoguanine DNA glycosylase
MGAATLHLRSVKPRTVVARAWGPGAAAALDGVPELIGADDDPPSLAGAHPLVTQLEKRLAGLRFGRSAAVLEALVLTILAQRVIGGEASFAYRAMVSAPARPAPEPDPPLTWPDARWLASAPAWALHRCVVR